MSKELKAQFGQKVRPQDLAKFEKSPQWDGKKFVNQIETTMSINLHDLPKLLKENFKDKKKRIPENPIPIIPFNEKEFATGGAKFIWYGHSVGLLQLDGKNILIDPMLGPNASPIAPFATKRFSDHSLDVIDTLPPLDAVLVTHDHYDHLDLASIKKLQSKCDNWLVALGVSRHLENWGIPVEQITELDWWDNYQLDSIEITFTPSRHFSGRGVMDRAKSLWGGWVFKSSKENIYWSGDGGYGPHFKEVGDKLGPFDWGFMECGQYHENWHAIHMYPEESVQAALEAKVKIATPVHWGGFSLALHSWKDPVKRFINDAKKHDLQVVTPEIGEQINMDTPPAQKSWWVSLK